jgi:hypothetical protein
LQAAEVAGQTEASSAIDNLLGMAKPRHRQVGSGGSLKTIGQTQDVADRSVVLRPATRSLRDVLDERGPLTGPITDAGTRALLAARGKRSDDGHGGR